MTHHHPDHVGNLARLREEYAFKLIVYTKTADALKSGEFNPACRPHNWFGVVLRFMVKLSSGGDLSFRPVTLTPDDVVFDDDGVDLNEIAGIDARIVYTPGHSDDSVSIVLGDKTAIVGDLCVNMPSIFGNRYVPPLVESLDDLYSSWRKLLDMGVTELYLGHGKPFLSEKLSSILEKAERRGR